MSDRVQDWRGSGTLGALGMCAPGTCRFVQRADLLSVLQEPPLN